MLNKSEKKEIAKVGAILFLITAIASGLLAYVNSVTAPVIAKNEQEKQQNAMRVVLPQAQGFEEKNLLSDKMDSTVTGVYKSSNDAGYVVTAAPIGYGGEISIVVGISKDGKVSGVNITSQSETAGLGAKCTDEEFLLQFLGKEENISVVKGKASNNQISAISSATITSKAVTSGVNSAVKAVKIAKEAE